MIRYLSALGLICWMTQSALGVVVDITHLGAKGDGVTKNTAAIQRAIDRVAEAGGGTVLIPAGTFVSGTLYLKNHITLDLSAGAVLKASPDKADYNADDFCPQNQVFSSEFVSGAHFIVAVEVHHVTIQGRGRIDGNREAFMNEVPENPPKGRRLQFKRPAWRPGQMLYFCESRQVTVRDVELYHAPYWTCFFHGCEDVMADGLRIYTDWRGYNNDGLDIDCCSHVIVSNCNINTEDDCITLRGNPKSLKKKDRACEYVTISNCILQTPCNAVRIGVGSGVVRHCNLSNLIIHNTRTALCFIAAYLGKGGCTMQDIAVSNVRMECKRPILIASDTIGPTTNPGVPIENITLSNIQAKGCWTSSVFGNSDALTRNIVIENSVFEYSGGEDIPATLPAEHGVSEFAKYRTGNSAIQFQNVQGVRMNHVSVRWRDVKGPWKKAVKMIQVKDAVFHDCELSDCPVQP